MENFWNTEEGKILSYGMHEHGNATCNIGSNIKLINHYIENNKLDVDDLKLRLESILKSLKRAEDAVDYIYSKFKNRVIDKNLK